MIIDENFNVDKLIEFMDALTWDSGRIVFLILDNLRVHQSKPVKGWREEHKAKIEVFTCPVTARNPDERRRPISNYDWTAGIEHA